MSAPAAREIDEIRDELEGVDANGKHDTLSRLGQPQGGADEEESIFEEADWNVEPKLNRFKLMLTAR
jgi:hypothetical protein